MLTNTNYKTILPEEYNEFIRLIELEGTDHFAEFINSNGQAECDEDARLKEINRTIQAMPTSTNKIINQHKIINCISIAILNKRQDVLDSILSDPDLDFSDYMGSENPLVHAFNSYQRDSEFDSQKVIFLLLTKKLNITASQFNMHQSVDDGVIKLIDALSNYNNTGNSVNRLIAEDKIIDLATSSIYSKDLAKQWLDKRNLHVLHESINQNSFLDKLVNNYVYYKIVRKSINDLIDSILNRDEIIEPQILFDATITLACAHLIRKQRNDSASFDMAAHYFISANNIVDKAVLSIAEGQKIFFITLKQFLNGELAIKSDAIFMLIQFIISLQASLLAGSQEALSLLEYFTQKDDVPFLSVAASYILELSDYADYRTNFILSANWNALEALKSFYGLGGPVDLDDAYYQFQRLANNADASNANVAMRAHLCSMRILRGKLRINLAEQRQNTLLQESKRDEVISEQQLQDMELANSIRSAALTNIFQNALQIFKSILTLNIALSRESLRNEIYAAIFVFSKALKSYKDKNEMLNIAIDYFKVSSVTIFNSLMHDQWNSDFLKHILSSIRESGLLEKVTNWNRYITKLRQISKKISNHDYITIILNEFELLANHARTLNDNDELQYLIRNELIALQKYHLNCLSLQQLHHAIANLDELVKLDNNLAVLGRRMNFNLREYCTIYTAVANNEIIENKYKYYSQALNLGDAAAILGMLHLSEKHNIIIVNIAFLAHQALTYAVFPENEIVIRACYNKLDELQQTAVLLNASEAAENIQDYFNFASQVKSSLNSTYSNEVLGRLINENYFPAIVKLMDLAINQHELPGYVSLYLSALVVSELTLRGAELKVKYGLSEKENQKMLLECYTFIGKYANKKTERYHDLAKWYMGYLAHLATLKAAYPELIFDSNASILCNAENSTVLVVADLVKASMMQTRFFTEDNINEIRTRFFNNFDGAILYISNEDKAKLIADASTPNGAELKEFPRSTSLISLHSKLWRKPATNSLPSAIPNKSFQYRRIGGNDAD